MDDLVWLLRHGDSYGQGVACAALSQYVKFEQLQWLTAVALVPACQLLASPDCYARYSAARLLAKLSVVHPHVPAVMVSSGAVSGLLMQIDVKMQFPYTRSSGEAVNSISRQSHECK